MRICIDSCIFVNGLRQADPPAVQLPGLISPALTLVIPRLVGQEVTRNLRTAEQVRLFYRLFQQRDFAFIVDEPVPRELVDRYAQCGLPEKADAYIGAFAEWMEVERVPGDEVLQAELGARLEPAPLALRIVIIGCADVGEVVCHGVRALPLAFSTQTVLQYLRFQPSAGSSKRDHW